MDNCYWKCKREHIYAQNFLSALLSYLFTFVFLINVTLSRKLLNFFLLN